MKKLLAILLALVMVFAVAACTPSNEADTETEVEVEQTETETNTETGDDKVTLNLWHIWVDDIDAQRINMENAVAAAEEAFPNVDIVISSQADEDNKVNLPISLKAMVEEGTDGPDIFYFQAAGVAKELADAGHLLDLTPYYQADAELQSKLSEASMVYSTYDDKIYGYTYGNACAYIYYNKAMFKEYDVKVPTTYDELLEAGKAFSAEGIVPMSVAGADAWPVMFQFGSIALKEAGAAACNAALAGKGDFTAPEFVAAAEKLQELAAAGFYSESVLSVDYMGAQNALAAADDAGNIQLKGDAAMFYMGNWAGGLLANEDIGVIIWPTSDPAYANDRFGGADKAFFVSAGTKNPDVAAAVCAFITEQMSANEAMPTFSNIEVDPTDQLAVTAAGGEGYTLWWDTGLGGEKGGVCNGYCVDLLTGELTPEDFCEKMQELATS